MLHTPVNSIIATRNGTVALTAMMKTGRAPGACVRVLGGCLSDATYSGVAHKECRALCAEVMEMNEGGGGRDGLGDTKVLGGFKLQASTRDGLDPQVRRVRVRDE